MPAAHLKHRSARFNTRHPEQKRVVEIIEVLEKKGFSFQQIVTDAVLRADGIDPVVFQTEGQANKLADILSESMENLIAKVIREALKEYKPAQVSHSKDESVNDDSEINEFAKSFASGFANRAKRKVE